MEVGIARIENRSFHGNRRSTAKRHLSQLVIILIRAECENAIRG
jgi:hypothetical protein